MCELEDFKHLELDDEHKNILENELRDWHEWYLPVGDNVLDIGAGNGETAQFYLNHGAKKIICIEPKSELLTKNFGNDNRVIIVPYRVDNIKSDCEGGEKNMIVETHFPFYIEQLKNSSLQSYNTNAWRIHPIIGGDKTMRWSFNNIKYILINIHLVKIQITHFIRMLMN